MRGKRIKKTGIVIYLAGPFTNPDWRDRVLRAVPQHTYFDPRRNRQYSCVAIVDDDLLRGVEKSDLVFGYYPEGCIDQGTDIELGDAFGKKIPIILANENKFQNPLLSGIAKRHFTTLDAGIVYLNNLKSIGLEEEFEAIYKTIEDLGRGARR